MGVALKMPLFRQRREAPQSRRAGSRRRGANERPAGEERQSRNKAQRRRSAAKGATRQQAQKPVARKRVGLAWLNRLLVLAAMAVVVGAGVQAWQFLSGIQVERIAVKGELAHTQTQAVQDIVQPALAGGFLGTDLGEVQAELEALPWIYEARVRRVWPNALEIHVVEQLPIARWGNSGFLNHEGEVFRPSTGRVREQLPLLTGPEDASGALMATYLRLVDLFKPLGLRVTELGMDDRGEVQAVLAGGQKMMIGGDDFLERIQRFTRLYRAELAAQMDDIERIDLRYHRGIAVAFRHEQEEGQQHSDGA